jgi:hypothetical protein
MKPLCIAGQLGKLICWEIMSSYKCSCCMGERGLVILSLSCVETFCKMQDSLMSKALGFRVYTWESLARPQTRDIPN